ncbi:hypothetical protein AAHA92_19449 [Salvia divinorum]|uniref:TRF2/HOY1 PH-like domain-containing protein n=1 Tax=Salvia divinorum TaxID=28513 RepID=A0ABD1H5F3_SALDI
MPLDLPLKRTDTLLNLLQSKSSKAADNVDNVDISPPSYFPITTFTVGNWKRESSRQGDLTAKFLYGKKMVVWEFLDGPLKSKMEVSWSDITAIEAVANPNQPGFLRVELANPPFFFREITPQPRKRSSWEPVHDFTGGQAQFYRRYEATFPPGVLDKPYEKLLLHDARLAQLSRRLTSTIIATNAPTYCVGSSSQNPTVVPFIPPRSSCLPRFMQQGLSEAQYLVQNGANADEEANATCDDEPWSLLDLYIMQTAKSGRSLQ